MGMTYGRDNYRLKVCFTWDKAQTEGTEPSGWNACVGDPKEVPGTLTVWRKVFYFPDAMSSSGHSDAINESKIAGGFDDGFLEMQASSAEQPAHAVWLWKNTTPAGVECDQEVSPGEIPPNSLGVRTYAHSYVNRYSNPEGGTHPPVPLHSVQSLGAHILAHHQTPGDPPGRFSYKVFGVACLPWPSDPVHTSVAVFTITKSNDPGWMDPDRTLQEECEVLTILGNDCATPDQMQERVPLHEFGHAVGGWDHSGDCDWNALNTSSNNSVMVNTCLYHRNFQAFFSFTQIHALRQGSIQIQ